MGRQLGWSTEPHTPLFGTLAAISGPRTDEFPLEFRYPRASAAAGPWAVVVSHQASARLLNPTCRSPRACSVLRRSRVDRANRSRRETINVSPVCRTRRTLASSARLVFAPLAVSEKTFAQPAARRVATWEATVCPSVETRP